MQEEQEQGRVQVKVQEKQGQGNVEMKAQVQEQEIIKRGGGAGSTITNRWTPYVCLKGGCEKCYL